MRIDELDQAIKAVCPIDGVSFGILDDSSTWTIQFSLIDIPTPEQHQAALNILTSAQEVELPLRGEDILQNKLDELQATIDILQTKVEVVEGKVDNANEASVSNEPV